MFSTLNGRRGRRADRQTRDRQTRDRQTDRQTDRPACLPQVTSMLIMVVRLLMFFFTLSHRPNEEVSCLRLSQCGGMSVST